MANPRARELRRNLTDTERKLWGQLRRRQLEGARFRRQVPIGPYIADFVCFEARLVVECDGGQHAESVADARRDAWFAGEGFRVLRFWNHDVLQNVEGVLAQILEVLHERLPPSRPSPARGGRSLMALESNIEPERDRRLPPLRGKDGMGVARRWRTGASLANL